MAVPTQDPTRLGGIDEIAEEEATGEISSAYGRVRQMLGVGFVPTIYRMAATHETFFLEALARLAPFISEQREGGFAHEVGRVARQSLANPSEVRLRGSLTPETSQLIEQYSSANPLNLLFALGLLGPGVGERTGVMSPPLPPRSEDVYADVRQCHGDRTVPGFWRELGRQASQLELTWTVTREEADRGGFDGARRAVLDFASRTIRDAGVVAPPNQASPEDAEHLHQLLGWFPTGIATMIVETEWLKSQR